jgi:aspartate aminotransferase
MAAEYQLRRDLVVDALEGVSRVSLIPPGGAFYAFPRIETALTSDQLVSRFADGGVLLRSGSEFGPSGEGHLRISFATDVESLTTGLDRFRAAVSQLEV